MKNFITILFLFITFATLITLGTWQVQRLQWKNDIIAKLKIVYADNAVANHYDFDDLQITNDDLPVLYGSITGRYNYDKEILVGPRTMDGDIGYFVITPLNLKQGNVFVHRGFIKVENKERVSETHMNKPINVSGLFRIPDWNSFTPNNNPENDVWTKLDLKQIAAAKNLTSVAPVLLYAEETSAPHALLKQQKERWMPRNKHQQYAIFWFGMAFVLAMLIGLYIRSLKAKN